MIGLLKEMKPLLGIHYVTNVLLAVIYFLVKTTPGVCTLLFTNCQLEMREWEWLTFLGCVVVLKNRKLANAVEYIETSCLFAKALSAFCFFNYHPFYALVYVLLCLGHLVFFPQPVYQGPESIVYFRGPNLYEELERDKRVTWLVVFYVAWSPKCVSFAPVFSELSHEYSLDNFKFGKIDVSRYPEVAERYNINIGALSRQLPTVILFEDGVEVDRRPTPTKMVTIKYDFKKESMVRDFGINEIYSRCKKSPSSRKKDREAVKEADKKDN